MADVLVELITKQRELRSVGPEDSAILCDPVHADGGVFGEVVELSFALLKGASNFLALVYFSFERPGLLLQEDDSALPLLVAGDGGIAFGRDNVGVLGADGRD